MKQEKSLPVSCPGMQNVLVVRMATIYSSGQGQPNLNRHKHWKSHTRHSEISQANLNSSDRSYNCIFLRRLGRKNALLLIKSKTKKGIWTSFQSWQTLAIVPAGLTWFDSIRCSNSPLPGENCFFLSQDNRVSADEKSRRVLAGAEREDSRCFFFLPCHSCEQKKTLLENLTQTNVLLLHKKKGKSKEIVENQKKKSPKPQPLQIISFLLFLFVSVCPFVSLYHPLPLPPKTSSSL